MKTIWDTIKAGQARARRLWQAAGAGAAALLAGATMQAAAVNTDLPGGNLLQGYTVPTGITLTLASGSTISLAGTFTGSAGIIPISLVNGAGSGTVTQVTGANGIGVALSTSTPQLTLPFTLTGSGSLSLSGTTSISGGGAISLGGFTLTVPATGTTALLGTAQTFSQVNTFNQTVNLGGLLSLNGGGGNVVSLTLSGNGYGQYTFATPDNTGGFAFGIGGGSAGNGVNNSFFFFNNTTGTWAAQIAKADSTFKINAPVTAQKIYGNTAAPTIASGTGAGTSPTVQVVKGNDMAFTVSVSTGTSPAGSNATIATITFSSAYTSTPSVVFAPTNSNSAQLSGVTGVFVTASTSNIVIKGGSTGLTQTTSYTWDLHVIGN